MRNGLLIDYELCTGCHTCEVACKVEHGIPTGQWGIHVLDDGLWPIDEKNNEWNWNHVPVPTDLCDLCAERTEIGKLPSCVHHCEAACMEYGDMEELSKRLAILTQSNNIQMKLTVRELVTFDREHPGMTLRMVCHTPEALRVYQVDWNMFYQETKPHE